MDSNRTLTCKQCGLVLPETEFKQYTSRSEGLRRTTTGRYTICKHCEKLSAYAAKLQKLYESGKATETDLQEREALIQYYQGRVDAGQPLVTKPVRRLMGVPEEAQKRGAKSRVMAAIAEAQRRQEVATNTQQTVSSSVDSLEGLKQTAGKLREIAHDCTIDAAVNTLSELLTEELVREPAYYEAECDGALQALRSTSDDGKVPEQFKNLANMVLEKLDEYADTYDG